MDRRQFVTSSALLAAAATLGWRRSLAAHGGFNPSPADGWRTFEVSIRAEPAQTGSATRVWLPLPSIDDAEWSRPIWTSWESNARSSRIVRDPEYGALIFVADWAAGDEEAFVEVTSRVATRDRALDLARPAHVPPLDDAARRSWTKPTRLLPTDGIVYETSARITRGAKSDLDKARALYEWVVDNTARNPKTRGCGIGDIRAMLESGDLSGKCADLNALYVGLARAAGLAARDVYGIRVADSRFAYRSLGKSGEISKAQHCRAEVWLAGFGWVPVDPADVRKVVLEERPGLTLGDEIVVAARQKLFGAWEMNWVAYNCAHDLRLPGSAGPEIPFLMYPCGESGAGRFDSLDPDGFRYRISSREVTT